MFIKIKLYVTGVVFAALLFSSCLVAQVVVPIDEHLFVIPLKKASNDGSEGSDFETVLAEFDYVMRDKRILTGFPIGHNLPKATNELFYNLELDGYGGMPFGSCLKRGYLLPVSDPRRAECTANENKDLMRVWANRNPNLKNVLLKNMTIKNAFRTYNLVDGEVVTRSNQLPHTDTFQSFYNGSSVENPDWLVIQDTLIKNSDNSLMIHGGGKFAGAVYQNLQTGCDAEFRSDTRTRVVNDYAAFNPSGTPERTFGCTNAVSFATSKKAPVWLIELNTGGAVRVTNGKAPVILVGESSKDVRVTDRDANRRIIPHANVRYYATIEAALEVEARPPFIELSCAGWSVKPKGCESRLGYLN